MRLQNLLHIHLHYSFFSLSECGRYLSASKVITMVNGKWEVAGGTKGKKAAQGKKSPKKMARKPEPSAPGVAKVVQEDEDDTFALKSMFSNCSFL